jgi:hypothetical protein
MEKKNDGGPAFPTYAASIHPAELSKLRESMGWSMTQARDILGRHPGMTLRDWFAGQALAGLVAWEGIGNAPDFHAMDAGRCYAMADAMLAAREVDK